MLSDHGVSQIVSHTRPVLLSVFLNGPADKRVEIVRLDQIGDNGFGPGVGRLLYLVFRRLKNAVAFFLQYLVPDEASYLPLTTCAGGTTLRLPCSSIFSSRNAISSAGDSAFSSTL